MTDKNLIPEEARDISAYDVNAPGFQAIVASWIEGILTRAGEDALLELIKIGQSWHQIKEQYFKDDPDDADLFIPNTSEDLAIMEAADSFSRELYKDKQLQRNTTDEIPEPGELSKAIRRTIERLKQGGLDIPSIAGKRVKDVDFPVDKVNANIWNLLEKDLSGQIKIAVETRKRKGRPQQLNILYTIDFDALGQDVKITRKLEPFDKWVYIAVGALWAAGNQTITEGQIYDVLRASESPGDYDRKRISKSIEKMTSAHIYIDNTQEAEAYRYARFIYDASLLPMERISAVINGRQVDSAIHLFREPPLISFARGRKQITTIKRELLSSPLSMTDQNIAIQDYMLERIAHARNGTLSVKIKLNTIFEKCNIRDKKQKQRTPEKIRRLLDFYTQQGHISGYLMDTESVTLKL